MRIYLITNDINFLDSLKNSINKFQEENAFNFSFELKKQLPANLNELKNDDIVFIPVNNDQKAFDLAHKIREKNLETPIIFLADAKTYAIEGYKVSAFDYLPITLPYNLIEDTLKRLFKYKQFCEDRKISIKSSKDVFDIEIKNITFIEISIHLCQIHTITKTYTTYTSLKKLMDEIASPSFVLINKCYYVNMKYITSIENGYAIMNNTEKLQISRSKKKNVVIAYQNYCDTKIQ
ncbi:MAG: LytTR family transcriptional regulator DNA-binding domain-containing protein [Bacilli bacterium]|nr:LytTR family transcriptional regulator DNA-binding domain-containing protein [Bacilli bacterium]